MAYIARNKAGRVGLVLGNCYDHKNGGTPYKFWGIGLEGGSWKSRSEPEFIEPNIKSYFRDLKRSNSHAKDDKH